MEVFLKGIINIIYENSEKNRLEYGPLWSVDPRFNKLEKTFQPFDFYRLFSLLKIWQE